MSLLLDSRFCHPIDVLMGLPSVPEIAKLKSIHCKMWPKNAIRRITVLQKKTAKYGRSNRRRTIFHRFLRTRVKRRPMEDGREDSCSKTTTRKQKLLYCGHCSTKLPKSTYYRHRADYFVEVKLQWCIKIPRPPQATLVVCLLQHSTVL